MTNAGSDEVREAGLNPEGQDVAEEGVLGSDNVVDTDGLTEEIDRSEDGILQTGEFQGGQSAWDDDLLAGLRDDLIAASTRIKDLEAEVLEQKGNYLRAVADLDNFRKRSQKERLDMIKYQGEDVIRDLLEVLDNLELALSYQDSDHKQLLLGLQMVCRTFVDKLDRWGVRPKTAVGAAFDPATHAAISRITVPTEGHGVVISEIKKAYFYKDKLIRVGEAVVNEVLMVDEVDSESDN